MSSNQHYIHNVSPTSIRHVIGQKSVVEQVLVALDAAHMDNTRFEHALLEGPPGVGKSALAQVISYEMATTFYEVLGQSIKNISDLNALLLSAKDKDVVHIDECHELRKTFQTSLYMALDKRMIILRGNGDSPAYNLKLDDFTLLLSTTESSCVLAPLRDRMRIILRFDYYPPDDLATIAEHRCRALGWNTEEFIPQLIAARSRGTPRLALRLLQSCYRVCRAKGQSLITRGHLLEACRLEGLDCLGLGPVDRQYLRTVAGGLTRLNVIASMLGLPTRTVSQVNEPFLIRVGLIIKDDQGRRQLTANGRQHLSTIADTVETTLK